MGHRRRRCCRRCRQPLSGRPPTACSPILRCLQVGHTDFVSAVAYAPPGLLEGCPGGAVVSGSRDTTVMVWDLQTATPVQRLEGHQYQVGNCC